MSAGRVQSFGLGFGLWLACFAALLAGCEPGAAETETETETDAETEGSGGAGAFEVPLVDLGDLAAWTPVDAADDPLADHRPQSIDCPIAAWAEENGQLEVQTGVCNYLALAQPSQVAVAAGDRISVDLWHADLDAAEAASGHVAVLVAGELVGEATVEIPSEAAVLHFEWRSETPIPAGVPVLLHLHNHGYNSWTFVAIDVLGEGSGEG